MAIDDEKSKEPDKISKTCTVWGSNSRPSDFWTRLWDWRAAYCANEATADLTFSCDIVTGCTSHVDWLSAKARYFILFYFISGNWNYKVQCFLRYCRAVFVSDILLSLKCLQSLLSARRSTDILCGHSESWKIFQAASLKIIRRKPWNEPLDKKFYLGKIKVYSFVSRWNRFGCWSWRFDCNTASLHQAMTSIVCVSLFVARWFAAIGAFRSSLLFRLLDVVPS